MPDFINAFWLVQPTLSKAKSNMVLCNVETECGAKVPVFNNSKELAKGDVLQYLQDTKHSSRYGVEPPAKRRKL